MCNAGWVDRDEYPFEDKYLDLPMGRMHYIDEGEGKPIVFVHGTPTWSFLYRKMVRQLRSGYRCVAMDHIGFGLSDKPEGWAYTPEAHAANVRTLIDHLGLREITLVVHDFGGPIGLSYAIDRPDNVDSLVIFNTWMWSLRGERRYEMASSLFSSPIGRFLYERLSFSTGVMMRQAAVSKEELSAGAYRHYVRPFSSPRDRTSTWVLARELVGSSDWYESLWTNADRLAGKPSILAWGLRDPAFGPAALARWQRLLPQAQVASYEDVGHFVPEAKGEEVAGLLATMLAQRQAASGQAEGLDGSLGESQVA